MLVIAIAQYLAAYYILQHQTGFWPLISDLRLLGTVGATALSIAGGYIINAFYDVEKDLANRPQEVIIGRILSKTFALRGYLLLSMSALLLSALLQKELLLFNGLFTFGLWFYSHKLKKKPLWGNLAAATLTVAPFFAVCVYYGFVNRLLLVYAIFIILITLIREIVKDLEALKGDLIFGYQTFPVVYGLRKSKKLLYMLMLGCILPFFLLYISHPLAGLLWYFVGCALVLCYAAWRIHLARKPVQFGHINTLLKLLILTGVASIMLL